MTKRIESIQLVEGIFSPVDAANVLLYLINDKIKFHQVQMLGVHEGRADRISHSATRIKVLESDKQMVSKLVLKARDEGYELKIDSNVEIRLVSNHQS